MEYGIDAVVVASPVYARGVGLSSAFAADALESGNIGAEIRSDLQSIQVSHHLGQPFGQFSLELSPREVAPGQTWADILAPYTLVSIALQRTGEGLGATDNPVPVMLGLVDTASLAENFAAAAPSRSVRISGRSLSAVLVDHRWWFHHFLTASGTVEPPDVRSLYRNPPAGMAALRDEVALRSLGFLAIDADMFKDVVARHPVEAMRVAWEFFVGGSGRDPFVEVGEPFIKLQFADGRPIGTRLVFDPAAALSSHVDSGARLMQQFVPTQFPEASCWQALQHFAEAPFTEFFVDTYGDDPERAYVQVVARKPPWCGHVEYDGSNAVVAFANGGAPSGGVTRFDRAHGTWSLDGQTALIDGSDIIARNLQRGSRSIYSFYEVRPAAGSMSGAGGGDALLQRIIPPVIDEDPDSPSFIQRYGIRPFKHLTKYIPIVSEGGNSRILGGDIARHSMAYAALAREWFHPLPSMWAGTYQVKGNATIRIGNRLLDASLGREFYVQGVSHAMTFAGSSPRFTTSVEVARGWDVTL